jgi:hypothetical protein
MLGLRFICHRAITGLRSVLELFDDWRPRITNTWSTLGQGRFKLLHAQHIVIQSITLGFLGVLLNDCYNQINK